MTHMKVNNKDRKAWTDFNRAARNLIDVLNNKNHTLHSLIFNDIDHTTNNVRIALDRSKRNWRQMLKVERPRAIVLSPPLIEKES